MIDAYLTAQGTLASAGAPRPVAGGPSNVSCSWLIAAPTKQATRTFVDAMNHRPRRLWEPSQ
jgi:hypothetical protein